MMTSTYPIQMRMTSMTSMVSMSVQGTLNVGLVMTNHEARRHA